MISLSSMSYIGCSIIEVFVNVGIFQKESALCLIVLLSWCAFDHLQGMTGLLVLLRAYRPSSCNMANKVIYDIEISAYFFFPLICSDAQMPRNVACPVSPRLHPQSAHHANRRLSPSPISSPRVTSGSSTPLTAGSGTTASHLPKLPTNYLHEGMGTIPRSPNSHYLNGNPSFQNLKPDMFQGRPQTTFTFRAIVPAENGFHGDQFGRRATKELYGVQSALADRVSQQLLREHVKLNPSLNLKPYSPVFGRSNRV
ncbi:unnamed protein product [Ilex paraguariensis]|uniref:Uncharacterized protein n=1 Tax=Ilex paraguariensis TaxID=185542 RepID=A0ABC8SHE6_9AQUA